MSYRRALCLGLLGLLSVATVPVAQASEDGKFTSASYPAKLTAVATSVHEFAASGGALKCGEVHTTGEIVGPTRTLTLHSSYRECTAFGFIGATVTMNGCDFLYHITGTGSGGSYTGTTDIVCPKDQEITIDAGPCTTHVPAQTGLKTVTFTNGSGDLVFHENITGTHGTLTKNNFLCFFTAGTFTNGTATGSTTSQGYNQSGSPQSIDIG